MIEDTYIKELEDKPIKLILFSGGIDSTYLLWYYLTKTDYQIITLHVDLRVSYNERWKYENYAVENIINYCKNNYRDFYHSKIILDIRNFSDGEFEIPAAAFLGSFIARSLSTIDSLTINDGELDYKVRAPEVSILMGFIEEDNVSKNSINDKIIELITKEYSNIKSEVEKPILSKNKSEIIKEIPPSLLKYTWSCRAPINGEPCGECDTCILIRDSMENL